MVCASNLPYLLSTCHLPIVGREYLHRDVLWQQVVVDLIMWQTEDDEELASTMIALPAPSASSQPRKVELGELELAPRFRAAPGPAAALEKGDSRAKMCRGYQDPRRHQEQQTPEFVILRKAVDAAISSVSCSSGICCDWVEALGSA